MSPLGLPGDLTLFLLRHGQTRWNVEGRLQGRLDSPLTELGRQQAALHALTLAGVPLTRAYTSPLGRAFHTARRVLQGRNVPLYVLDDLAELDAGDGSGLTRPERLARFPGVLAARERDKYRTAFPGGESYEAASPRVVRALECIAAQGPGNALIVSHEMVGRLIRLHLLGLTPEQAMGLSHPQDMVYRVRGGQQTVLLPLTGAPPRPPSP